MQYLHWLTAAAALGICGVPVQAMALPHALRTTPLTMADALTAEQPSQDRLSQLADEMGQHVGRQEGNDTADLVGSLNIPLLDDLLDESGEVRLPMGLTVYDAMGTTSIGFGSKF